MNNAHLEGYQAGGVINVCGGKKFRETSPLFSRSPNARVSNRHYFALEKNTEMPNTELYYNPVRPSAVSTLENLAAGIPKKNRSDVRNYLEQQDTHITDV
jgi:hypothetical protein